MQLKTARCKLGLRLFDVGRELRISADYLKLLEAGDFDQLPAPTYVSGFLRSYGKLVGLDAAELASRFYALQGSASAQMSYKLPVTGGPPQRSAPAMASLCVVLAVIAYGGWYWMNGPTPPNTALESEQANNTLDSLRPRMMEQNAVSEAFESTSRIPVDSNRSKDVDASVTLKGDLPSANALQTASPALKNETETATVAAVSTDAETAGNDNVTSALMNSEIVSSSVLPSTETDRTVSVSQVSQFVGRTKLGSDAFEQKNLTDEALTLSRGAAVATMRVPAQEMTVRAIASSWVEVVRGDGTSVFKKLMKAGDSYVFDDSSGLYLSTGNAGGIEIVTSKNEAFKIGSVGEIVRDLPLVKTRLRDRF